MNIYVLDVFPASSVFWISPVMHTTQEFPRFTSFPQPYKGSLPVLIEDFGNGHHLREKEILLQKQKFVVDGKKQTV